MSGSAAGRSPARESSRPKPQPAAAAATAATGVAFRSAREPAAAAPSGAEGAAVVAEAEAQAEAGDGGGGGARGEAAASFLHVGRRRGGASRATRSGGRAAARRETRYAHADADALHCTLLSPVHCSLQRSFASRAIRSTL